MGKVVLGALTISGITAVLVAAHPASAVRTATRSAADTVTVQMIGSSSGYQFQPSTVQIKVGQTVKFVTVSGGPHNITFDPQDIPDGAAATLAQNMPNQQAKLTGPLVTNPNDSYAISFKDAKPGAYKFYCLPHQSLGMQGTIIVE
jgi:plastocyanin